METVAVVNSHGIFFVACFIIPVFPVSTVEMECGTITETAHRCGALTFSNRYFRLAIFQKKERIE